MFGRENVFSGCFVVKFTLDDGADAVRLVKPPVFLRGFKAGGFRFIVYIGMLAHKNMISSKPELKFEAERG